MQAVADDFTVLGKLGALTALMVRSSYVRVNNDAMWRCFLGSLPRLQQLRLGATCRLPLTALVSLGQCCRGLRELSLNMWSEAGTALDHIQAGRHIMAAATTTTMAPPTPALFPQLSQPSFDQPIKLQELHELIDGESHP